MIKYIPLVLMLCYSVIGRSQSLTVTQGLKIHLEDASVNFLEATTSSPARWIDISGGNNHMTAYSVAASPVFDASANGVYFDGMNDIMRNELSNSTFSDTEATLFVVRTASTPGTTVDTVLNNSNWNTLFTISSEGTHSNEFALYGDWAMHHTYGGQYTFRMHQCYQELPSDQPVVLAGAFGNDIMDIDYYVNSIQSAMNIITRGTPQPYTVENRRIYLGGRPIFNTPAEFFDGTILEVLAYNRLLTSSEIYDVNEYLRCKYNIHYEGCTEPVDCIIEDTKDPEDPNSVKESEGIFGHSYIRQNNPNPFVYTTDIEYYVDDMQNDAQISIMDVSGKLIYTVRLEKYGHGKITINSQVLKSGMYFYTLVVGGVHIDTKKLIIR